MYDDKKSAPSQPTGSPTYPRPEEERPGYDPNQWHGKLSDFPTTQGETRPFDDGMTF